MLFVINSATGGNLDNTFNNANTIDTIKSDSHNPSTAPSILFN